MNLQHKKEPVFIAKMYYEKIASQKVLQCLYMHTLIAQLYTVLHIIICQ